VEFTGRASGSRRTERAAAVPCFVKALRRARRRNRPTFLIPLILRHFKNQS